MKQSDIIYNYLTDEWTPSWNLIKVKTNYGWLGSGADRIARLMVEKGIIERKHEGKYAYYRRKQ